MTLYSRIQRAWFRGLASLNSVRMAKSKYEYVRKFEVEDRCLPETWMVVRLDGRCFHKFSEDHKFEKPNDKRALDLMNRCAESVVHDFSDIVLGYGQSDEYSFVFKRSTNLFKRRPSKIISTVVSYFSSCYVFHWAEFFPAVPLQYPPSFDARVVTYPTIKSIRDYLSWRQVDCHINNLYNSAFWALVKNGMSLEDAEKELRGTDKSDKNEILFSKCGINYNHLDEMFRKGSVLVWELSPQPLVTPSEAVTDSTHSTSAATDSVLTPRKSDGKLRINILHEDIIGDSFWTKHPNILI